MTVPNCKFSPINGEPFHESAGVEALRADPAYRGAWTYNPWTGLRRLYGDVESDPQCLAVWMAEWGPMPAASDPETKAPAPALSIQVGGSHYKDMKIQPFEFIHANAIPWAEGSVIQYLVRWRAKGGIEDVKKARHILDLLIEAETKNR